MIVKYKSQTKFSSGGDCIQSGSHASTQQTGETLRWNISQTSWRNSIKFLKQNAEQHCNVALHMQQLLLEEHLIVNAVLLVSYIIQKYLALVLFH